MAANTIKYIARFKAEADTPFRVGSGKAGLLVDQLVIREANGLPYIPGTSLAGVIRHELEERSAFSDSIKRLFGFQKVNVKDSDPEIVKGQGSRIMFSAAAMLAADGQRVHEGLEQIDFTHAYYRHYEENQLPERDHVKINHKGVAVKHAKYEEQLVYKGTRFVFEIELEGTKADENVWEHIIHILHQPTFRIGAGTRKGLGQLRIVESASQVFDLEKQEELKAYLKIGSSLNSSFGEWTKSTSLEVDSTWQPYPLQLKADNFFLFGAGLQDADADATPKTERTIVWTAEGAELTEVQKQLLIPATSIKGALSHRVAFHYNKSQALTIEGSMQADWKKDILLEEAQRAIANISFEVNPSALNLAIEDTAAWQDWIDKVAQQQSDSSLAWNDFTEIIAQEKNVAIATVQNTGELNAAVLALFGKAKETLLDEAGKKIESGQRGRVLLSDVFLKREPTKDKVFNHVAIDRFTGGGIDGALFQEKVATYEDTIHCTIYVDKAAFKGAGETEEERTKNGLLIKTAFEAALTDLKTGHLALGGHTTKGHGVFREV